RGATSCSGFSSRAICSKTPPGDDGLATPAGPPAAACASASDALAICQSVEKKLPGIGAPPRAAQAPPPRQTRGKSALRPRSALVTIRCTPAERALHPRYAARARFVLGRRYARRDDVVTSQVVTLLALLLREPDWSGRDQARCESARLCEQVLRLRDQHL